MKDIQVRLGNRVRDLREKAELSQLQLALLADIDRTYISSLENGNRNVSINNILKLANALGYTVKEFFNIKDFDEILFNIDKEIAAEKKPNKYE